jgi:hypothetical protein
VAHRTIALYDQEKCIEHLMEAYECTRDVAEEYFEFNVVRSYVGDRTPAFAVFPEAEG